MARKGEITDPIPLGLVEMLTKKNVVRDYLVNVYGVQGERFLIRARSQV